MSSQLGFPRKGDLRRGDFDFCRSVYKSKPQLVCEVLGQFEAHLMEQQPQTLLHLVQGWLGWEECPDWASAGRGSDTKNHEAEEAGTDGLRCWESPSTRRASVRAWPWGTSCCKPWCFKHLLLGSLQLLCAGSWWV